ncbi:unnamed protein product [Prorocentrum cordatum]|uniref:Translocation protein SEC62 n=1 Tax=Prorocentrum cordatum TaxID=2364126 RepID=A0ABN9RBS9_9DINO|nr:unnamed protein product [Polarella glacialis]
MGAALRRGTREDGARSPSVGQESGAGGPLATRLREAAEEAVRCSADRVRFVNDSEERLDQFSRALNQVKRKRFRDERQILEAIDKKGEVVHFLLDCVRNHFPSRRRIIEVKALLSEHSPAWSRAFDDHRRGCPTCKTVDLTVAQAPSPPPEPLPWVKLPIPFVLELVALCGVVIPLLVILQRGSCALHWLLFLLGILLMSPLTAVLVLRVSRGRAWLLAHFAPGQYVLAKARHRPLPCAWRPSRWFCWHESEEALVETDAARPAPRSLHSYGFWMTRPANDIQASRMVTVLPAAAPAAGPRGSASGQQAARSGAPPAPGAAPGEEEPGRALAVSCRELRLERAPAVLQGSGDLAGLPRECRFDGSCLLVWPQGAAHPPQLLAKVGAWRRALYRCWSPSQRWAPAPRRWRCCCRLAWTSTASSCPRRRGCPCAPSS